MSNVRSIYRPLTGGLDLKTPVLQKDPGRLLQCQNVEQNISGGYSKIQGYTKHDPAVVPGEGNILGVWKYGGKVYAFRNAVGGATAEMHWSTGSGWTTVKTGLSPGGSYEFVNYNFAGTYKMYGVSGVHKAFQWDGTTWTDITTGMATDTPEHIIGHKKHLFLSFGSSVQHSSLGDPLTFSPVTGAAEIALTDGVTNFMQLTGGQLAIFGRSALSILAGSSSADWTNTNLKEYGNDVGAVENSVQQLGSRVEFLNDIGVIDLATADTFGDFADNVVSYDFQKILDAKKDLLSCSCVVKAKSQYRLFFSDNAALYMTYRGTKMIGATAILFPIPVLKIVAIEDSSGAETIHFGSTNGYIYNLDDSRSFDGSEIVSFLRLSYDAFGKPRERKRYRRAILSMTSEGTSDIQIKPDFLQDSKGLKPPQVFLDGSQIGAGSRLGDGTLGSFILGAAYVIDSQVDVPGTGIYVSLFLYASSTTASWSVDGIMYDYIPSRSVR